MSKTGIIYGINGPVVYLKGDSGFKISEMVYVGKENLVGEVIGLKKGMTTVQVFEETTGLRPGETVTGTGDAISVLLGPGIIHNIFDGIQRPLEEIAKSSGKYISRGVSVDSLDTQKKWHSHITVKEGDVVGPGTIIAETQETASILHKSMVPPSITEGTVIKAAPDGDYTILEPIVTIQLNNGTTPTSCSCAAYPSIAFVVSAPMAVAAPATAAAVAAAAALSAVPIPLSTLVNPENFPFASSACSPLSFISFPISSAAFSAFSISSVVLPNSCSVFTSAAFW